MKGLRCTIAWTMAAGLLMATAGPGVAEKTTPATESNSAVPAVPRAIPDLIPYHRFDPPSSTLFDISKLTISGDLRVRPEFRTNWKFGSPIISMALKSIRRAIRFSCSNGYGWASTMRSRRT